MKTSAFLLLALPAAFGAGIRTAASDPSDHLFSELVPRLEIQLDGAAAAALRRDPRNYVLGTVLEGGTRYTNVSVKIKGAVGSFRYFDDRPALTLNFNRAAKGQRFHGLRKLYLNNSVQDGTLMNEMIASDLFLAAGVPAARATHAVVQLNDRRLGLYVLKEGYDGEFLKRHFRDAGGNLYDGGFLTDSDYPLEKDEGDASSGDDDRKALVAAAYERDLGRRRERLEAVLDVDRFLSFRAVEMFTCDWDGYTEKANNYRLYFDPDTGRAVFIPHGKDQLFERSYFPLVPYGGGLVAHQLLQVTEFRERYYERLAFLAAQVFTADRLTNAVNRIVARLRSNLAADLPRYVDLVALQSGSVQRNLLQRLESVQEEIKMLPRPLKYDADGSAPITGWLPRNDSGVATLYKVLGEREPEQLLIRTDGGRSVASWRTRMYVPPGRYRFLARVHTRDVEPAGNNLGSGAGLRLGGAAQSETGRVAGTVGNRDLFFDFEVEIARDVEFIAELRATRGEARFEVGSMRLRKTGER